MRFRLKNLLIAFAFAVSAIFFCVLSRQFPETKIPLPEENTVSLPTEKPAGTIRVASMNCKNYLSTNRYTADGKFKRRWAKPLAERAAMWQIFDVIRPDIVALQEIGGKKHLEELANDLRRETGLEFPYRVCLQGRDTHRRIGIISRFPFKKVFRFPETEKMSRGLLGAEIVAGTANLKIFTVHLKSKISRNDADPECAQERLGEAVCAGKKLARFKNDFAVLLGDFNDFPESAPVLRIGRESGFIRLDLRDSSGEAWTYRYFKMNETHTFDHLFVSPELNAKRLPGSGKIADDAWARRKLSDGKTVYASDHRMIFVDIACE